MPIIDWASRLKTSASFPLARGKVRRSILEAKASGKTGWFAAGRGGDLQPGGGGSKFIDLILNLQSDNAHNMLCLLLGESPLEPKRVLRLTFESDQPLPMDSTEKRHDWVAKADHIFTHNAAKIAAFLSIERSSN